MEFSDYCFTFLVSPTPTDFFETHSSSDEVSRAVDSRYWETRMTSSCELRNQLCTSTSTLDLEKSAE